MPRKRTPADAAEEAAIVARLTNFLAMEKTLSSPITWRVDGRNIRFVMTMEVDEITEPELFVFGRTSLHVRDRDVTLGLSWNDVRGRGGNFDRLDWRPLGAHNNKGLGPEELRFVLIEDTHHHGLAENALISIGLLQAMRDNLPVALPVSPDPPSWADLCAAAARRWNITDLLHVPEPPWQYGLDMPPRGSGRKKGRHP